LEVKILKVESTGLSRPFALYRRRSSDRAGYADFPLVAYHFKKEAFMTDTWIPLAYAVALI